MESLKEMSERNPRLIAEALRAQLGASALSHAQRRLEDLRVGQDVSAQQVWAEIVFELMRVADDGGGTVH